MFNEFKEGWNIGLEFMSPIKRIFIFFYSLPILFILAQGFIK